MKLLSRLKSTAIFVALLAAFGLGAWASPRLQPPAEDDFETPKPPALAPTAKDSAAVVRGGDAPNYRAIIIQYGPAVVGVRTDASVPDVESSPSFRGPFGRDPFFEFFRNLPVPRGPLPMHGQGSGFIVDPSGMVLTNAHVVRDATDVTVRLSDRREYKAKVLGIDIVTDIAVLQIPEHDLPTVQFGDSDKIAVGDYVLAIGAPYGFEQSASSGIVSAKGRTLPGDSYVPFIQTDVAVNPGSSGGPLFDAAGNVVGINSQIYSNSGGYEGLSFAIPINVALDVKNQIAAHGRIEHARLGVTVQPLTQTLARSFKLDKVDGALISSVLPDTAGARSGLKPGDVILKFNGDPIEDTGELAAHVGAAKPGDAVELAIWRSGSSLSLKVELDSTPQLTSAGRPTAAAGNLGLAVRTLTATERIRNGVVSGVFVERASGPAASSGIRAGDIILSVNGSDIQSPRQLQDIVYRQSDPVALLIARGDARIFVPVPFG